MKMFGRRAVGFSALFFAANAVCPVATWAQSATPSASPTFNISSSWHNVTFTDFSSDFLKRASAPVGTYSTVKAKTFDHTLDADLRAAATAGDVAKVRDLFSRGADPNIKNTDNASISVVANAAFAAQWEVVRAFVEAGAVTEATNSEGATLLDVAILGENIEMVKYLLKAGADVNSRSYREITPIMTAVIVHRPDIMRVLIDTKADVNVRSADDNRTALIYACRTGFTSSALEIVKMLVGAGADVSVKATDSKNAIEAADDKGLSDVSQYLRTIDDRDSTLFNAIAQIYNGRATDDSSTRSVKWKAVKDAIANGANPRFSYFKTGVTPLMFLAYDLPGSDDATVQFVVAHSDLNAQEKDFNTTALYLSADNGNLKMVNWLVAAGADLNLAKKDKETPLDTALKHKYQSIVDVLLKAGAHENVLFISEKGINKLMLAAHSKPFDAARAAALLKAGLDVNTKNKDGETALFYACDGSSPDAVTFLLKNGAKAGMVRNDGISALMMGAQLSSGDDALAIVTALVAAGAEVNVKTKDGRTALGLARKKSNSRAAAVLVKAGADTSSDNMTASEAAAFDKAIADLDFGKPDPSSAKSSVTPTATPKTAGANTKKDPLDFSDLFDSLRNNKLMRSIQDNTYSYIEASSLIHDGLDINAANVFGATALSMACKKSTPAIVDSLLKLGAKPDAQADDSLEGSALLNAAGRASGNDALAIINSLVAAGANVKGERGSLALAAARKEGNLHAADALLKAGAKEATASTPPSATPKKGSAAATGTKAVVAETVDEDLILDSDGNTKLMLLMWMKTFDRARAEALIKKGVDVNAKDKGAGFTALINAAFKCTPEAVSFLLKSGAKINLANKGNWTPLMAAAERPGDDEALAVVKILIAAGADLNLKNENGDTALMLARSNNNPLAAAALLKAGAKETKSSTPAVKASANSDLAIDDNGNTKLLLLMTEKTFDQTKSAALIKAGVDINKANAKGETALITACQLCTPEAVAFLLKNGAKTNVADATGTTALMQAAKRADDDTKADDSNYSLAMVTALVAAGADINLKNNYGDNALDHAYGYYNHRAAKFLVKAGATTSKIHYSREGLYF